MSLFELIYLPELDLFDGAYEVSSVMFLISDPLFGCRFIGAFILDGFEVMKKEFSSAFGISLAAKIST